MLLYVSNPVTDVGKRLVICDVVNQKDAHGSTIVRGGDGAEALLAGRVPNLQLNALAIQFDGSDFEVNSNGGNKTRGERVIRESKQKAGLSDTYKSRRVLYRCHQSKGA